MTNGRPNPNADHFSSRYFEAPGGQNEMISIAMKVESFLDAKMPQRPNGQEPKIYEQREDRSRSKSRSKGRQRDDEVLDKWGHGEELSHKSEQIKRLIRTAQRELTDQGTVTAELQALLISYLGITGLEREEVEVKRILESVPIVERMTEIRRLIKQRQEEQLEDR